MGPWSSLQMYIYKTHFTVTMTMTFTTNLVPSPDLHLPPETHVAVAESKLKRHLYEMALGVPVESNKNVKSGIGDTVRHANPCQGCKMVQVTSNSCHLLRRHHLATPSTSQLTMQPSPIHHHHIVETLCNYVTRCLFSLQYMTTRTANRTRTRMERTTYHSINRPTNDRPCNATVDACVKKDHG